MLLTQFARPMATKVVVATTWLPVGIAFTHHLFSLGFMSAFNFVKPSRGCVTDLTHLMAGYSYEHRSLKPETVEQCLECLCPGNQLSSGC